MRRRHRQHLLGFWLAALVAHVVLFAVVRIGERAAPPEPALTGKFLKRRPVRQQVLERRRTPVRERRALRRPVPAAAVHARASRPRALASAAAQVVVSPERRSLPRRPPVPGHEVRVSGRLRSSPLGVSVAAAKRLEFGLELLDTEALDAGRYRAVVVRQAGLRRSLRGFAPLVAVGIESAVKAAAQSESHQRNLPFLYRGDLEGTDWRREADARALDELAGALTGHTGLRVSVDRSAWLGETGWQEAPFALLTGTAEFEPTAAEVSNLGRYLVSGGFAYVEVVGYSSFQDLHHGRLADLESLRGLVEAALRSQGLLRGVDWEMEPLQLTHPLFHCYYDIAMLPQPYWSVVQAVTLNAWADYRRNPERFGWLGQSYPELEGIFVKGRLVGIYSQRNYRDLWARRVERALTSSHPRTAAFYGQSVGGRIRGDAALRLGVNVVVYALTQEGALVHQVVARDGPE